MDKGFFIKAGLEEGCVLKVTTAEDFSCGAPCLLCGEFVELPRNTLGIVVCEDCKELWKKLKELQE